MEKAEVKQVKSELTHHTRVTVKIPSTQLPELGAAVNSSRADGWGGRVGTSSGTYGPEHQELLGGAGSARSAARTSSSP